MEYLSVVLFIIVIIIAIMVGICRWVFRVTHIVTRLDEILAVLKETAAKE